MIDYKSYYTKVNYRNFIEENFFLIGGDVKGRKVSYVEYVREGEDGLEEENGVDREDKRKEKIKIDSQHQ